MQISTQLMTKYLIYTGYKHNFRRHVIQKYCLKVCNQLRILKYYPKCVRGPIILISLISQNSAWEQGNQIQHAITDYKKSCPVSLEM